MDELRDASMLLLETAGPWLRSALESAVDALPAAVQCQGAEGLHALATLPETLEMATAEEYSAALYDAYTATIAAGTSWVQLLSLLGRPASGCCTCSRLPSRRLRVTPRCTWDVRRGWRRCWWRARRGPSPA